MSKNINLSDGFEEVTINNDPNRVIRINPTDFGFINRYNEAMKKIDELEGKYAKVKEDGLSLDEKVNMLEEVDAEARKLLNHIVGSDIADTVFGTANCMSLAGGQTIFENFLEAYVDYMSPAIKAEYKKSQQRVKKYTSQAKRIKR